MSVNPLWTINELSQLLKIEVADNVSNVCIDSRRCDLGSLFVGLVGENHNGGDFADQAIENGAVLAVVDRSAKFKPSSKVVVVDDTLEFLNKLALLARNRSKAKIIGVTGSVGKTTTKEMLRCAFSCLGSVYASEGNFNNHFGLPLCLANLHEDTEYAILEMGMSAKGEISRLTAIARPHLAIVTTVAAVHLEFFDSVSAIAHAKSEIYEGVARGGIAVVNFDNEYRKILEDKANMLGLVVYGFGSNPDAHARIIEYLEQGDKVRVNGNILGQSITFELSLLGKHNAIAALATLLITKLIANKIPLEAFEDFAAVKGRGAVTKIADNIEIVDESYNASPISMKAALNVLKSRSAPRKIVVLGDMKELGKESVRLHLELLSDIIESGADKVFLVGEMMGHLWDSIPQAIKGAHVLKQEDLKNCLQLELKAGDLVLFKASNSIGLHKLVEALSKSKN